MRTVLALLSTIVLLVPVPFLSGCQVATPAPAAVTVDVVVSEQGVAPNGARVEVAKGGQVTVTLTSHDATVLHVHGYEIEITATPGQLVSRTFVADKPGSFELETHDPSVIVGQLVVRA